MSGKFVRFGTNVLCEPTTHIWAGKGSWPLKMAQELVGGCIERVRVRYYGKLRDAYADEDGLSKRLPYNQPVQVRFNIDIVGPLIIWIPDSKPRRKE